ncbi:MAG: transcription termination factor NusA [Chloroflexota bacterium]
MKSDFMVAIAQLASEKRLPKEAIISAVESALVSAYRRESFDPGQEISVRVDPNTGEVHVFAVRKVVEEVTDPLNELPLAEAEKIRWGAQLGDTIETETTPKNAGRIAAQIAKQVVLQRLHEAEHRIAYESLVGKEGDVVTGVVRRLDSKQILIDLGRAEAIMPPGEQVPAEFYHAGQRLKLYLLNVGHGQRGTQIVVSRAHRNLVWRLLEMEIPEISGGVVELKAIAREPGVRSKVAVASHQQGVDPVGSCVGLRGIRIQNIMRELSGEKLDVISWSPDARMFITNALSPAHVVSVDLKEDETLATVVVPDKELSLAIGKQGVNARLAARLTGWRIDIKSTSAYEAEKTRIRAEMAAAQPATAATDEAEPEAEAVVAEAVTVEARAAQPTVEASAETAAPAEEVEEVVEGKTAWDEVLTPLAQAAKVSTGRTQIRFAEDIAQFSRRGRGKAGTAAGKKEDKAKGKKGPPKKARHPHEEDEPTEESMPAG